MKIVLTGGGTLGPVTPLLAVVSFLRKKNPGRDSFVWIGTKNGPEKQLVEQYGIEFHAVSSGKLRRYLSFKTFVDPFRIVFGYAQAKKILKKIQPDIVLSAGGFVAVPVSYAANHLGIPFMIHQMDAVPGLANKLLMKKAALVTVSLSDSLQHFPKEKTVLTGNPVREEVFFADKNEAKKFFGFEEDLPILLAMGGGTGAQFINTLIADAVLGLTEFCQVLHITGRGKEVPNEGSSVSLPPFQQSRYKAVSFLNDEMKFAYAASDLVLGRAGFATISELSALGKPVILVPLPASASLRRGKPNSPQVQNSVWLKRNNAAFVFEQVKLTPEKLIRAVRTLFEHPHELSVVGNNIKQVLPSNACEKFVAEMERVVAGKNI